MAKCSNCNGHGSVAGSARVCSLCGGGGRARDGNNCLGCNGSGSVPGKKEACTWCGGSGTVADSNSCSSGTANKYLDPDESKRGKGSEHTGEQKVSVLVSGIVGFVIATKIVGRIPDAKEATLVIWLIGALSLYALFRKFPGLCYGVAVIGGFLLIAR